MDFDTKFLKIIQKPQTPHNTGQYITHMFNSNHSSSQVDNINNNNETFNLDNCFGCGSMLDYSNNTPQDNFDIDDNLNCIFYPQTRRQRYMSCDITSFNEISLLNSNNVHNQPETASLDIKPFASLNNE